VTGSDVQLPVQLPILLPDGATSQLLMHTSTGLSINKVPNLQQSYGWERQTCIWRTRWMQQCLSHLGYTVYVTPPGSDQPWAVNTQMCQVRELKLDLCLPAFGFNKMRMTLSTNALEQIWRSSHNCLVL
jgi:hypothetical protein